MKFASLLRGRKSYAPQDWVDMLASWCGGFTEKRVLEVGCDLEGRFVSQLSRTDNPSEVIGLNVDGRTAVIEAGRCSTEIGDIRKTRFADRSFDVIVSSSAFEHIRGFDEALAEMYRILKPGGSLFSHFGPIWSTSYGHHLWLSHAGKLYTYHNVILPPYCHLLMTQDQVAEHMAGTYPSDVCSVVSEFVFTSDEQNQLFYEDYEASVAKSSFEVVMFKGYDHSELSLKYAISITQDTFRQLYEKYPGRRNFHYDGITLLLSKPLS